jgi:fatty acid-binding protein DegV
VAGIKVIADSACDLPSNLAEAHGIGIVPLDVRLGEWGPEEMKLVDPAEFWRRCAITDALPETSAPSPGAFAESFARAADEGSVSRSPPACRGLTKLRARGLKKCGGESTSESSTLGR